MLDITRELLKAEFCSGKAESCQEKQNLVKKKAFHKMLGITREQLEAESCQEKSFP